MATENFNVIFEALKAKAEEIMPPNSRAVLFGSRARGEAREDSDWDIHLIVPGGERLSLEEMGKYARPIEELGLEFDQYFSVLVYTLGQWQKRHFLPFYKNVEKDKIILVNNLPNDIIT